MNLNPDGGQAAFAHLTLDQVAVSERHFAAFEVVSSEAPHGCKLIMEKRGGNRCPDRLENELSRQLSRILSRLRQQ